MVSETVNHFIRKCLKFKNTEGKGKLKCHVNSGKKPNYLKLLIIRSFYNLDETWMKRKQT